MHRLRDDPHRRPERRFVRRVQLGAGGPVQADLTRLADDYRRAVDAGRLCQFAASLGLSVTSLCQLSVGWSAEHQAWSFPMTNAGGDVLGIRLRRPNGFKFAVTGGREGLFLPSTAGDGVSHLYVCEGPTDAAALLDIGFGNVVGRPSCTGGIRLLVELVRARRPAEIVIVADGDEPGRRGADNLASVLVAYAPAVRVVAPPRASRTRGPGCGWAARGKTWRRRFGRPPSGRCGFGRGGCCIVDKDNGLTLDWRPIGRGGKAALTLRLPDGSCYTDKADLTDPGERKLLLARLCKGRRNRPKGPGGGVGAHRRRSGRQGRRTGRRRPPVASGRPGRAGGRRRAVPHPRRTRFRGFCDRPSRRT